jgi:hypothetical protein
VVSQLKLRSFFTEAKVRWIIHHCKYSVTYSICTIFFIPFYHDVLVVVIYIVLELYDGIYEEDYANSIR